MLEIELIYWLSTNVFFSISGLHHDISINTQSFIRSNTIQQEITRMSDISIPTSVSDKCVTFWDLNIIGYLCLQSALINIYLFSLLVFIHYIITLIVIPNKLLTYLHPQAQSCGILTNVYLLITDHIVTMTEIIIQVTTYLSEWSTVLCLFTSSFIIQVCPWISFFSKYILHFTTNSLIW